MKFKRIPLLIVLILSLTASNALSQGLDSAGLCTRCKPCEDFYKYVNQIYLEKHPIPPDYSYWGPWSEVFEHNLSILHDILDRAAARAKSGEAPKGSNEQRIGDFYAAALDSVTVERRGIEPLTPEFDRIDQITNTQGLIQEIARLQSLQVEAPFAVGVDQDAKNSERMMLTVWQSGLGLPDRDYYFRPDKHSKELRDAYVKHIQRMLELAGISSKNASTDARSIFSLETILARASMTRVERRNPDSTYHDLSFEALNRLTPDVPWQPYLADIGASNVNDVNIGQPKFMAVVDSLIIHEPLTTWKAYLKWHVVSAFSPALSHAFVDEGFNFDKLLYGSNEQQARWKRSIRSTDRNLGEALGQEYVKTAFPPEAKQRMIAMIENLKEALRSDLTSLSWIGDTTRHRAIEKLEAFQQKVGYPDKWRDYSALTIARKVFREYRGGTTI